MAVELTFEFLYQAINEGTAKKTSVKFSKRQLIPNCTIYKMVKIAVELTFENFVTDDKRRHSRRASAKFYKS